VVFQVTASIVAFLLLTISEISAQHPKAQVGAYYFSGWNGKSRIHLTPSLIDSFSERRPIWGWTSTLATMKTEIDLAADNGLTFFNFCWYRPEKNQPDTNYLLNESLGFYLRAPNKKRLKFCLMVANHAGYAVGPAEWQQVTNQWLKLFKDSSYMKVDDKPLISFFSLYWLLKKFGSEQAIATAFNEFRARARAQGLKGVTIAVCVNPDVWSVATARKVGIDVLTGYNYPNSGFKKNNENPSIDSLVIGSVYTWNNFRKFNYRYMPTVTLNWDPRPWAAYGKGYSNSKRYLDYSRASVAASVKNAIKWLDNNPDRTVKERIIFLYAWNEYGEGAWLTPSTVKDRKLLLGLRQALSK
ncbi:MAG TPA: glycoside hydrolase family 99-like domain-containing protein, partial [Flavitalea sp.]|nr:glycoside hydrolase family 99-like domain-containing protein [Flavitalea sp.]